MRSSRSANSRPMLLITVATMAAPGSRPSRCSCLAAMSRIASPSTVWPCAIDEQRAVAVSVKSHAQPRRLARSTRSLQRLQVCRPAVQIDVAAVGLVADGDQVEPEIPEQAWARSVWWPRCAQSITRRLRLRGPASRKNLAQVRGVMCLAAPRSTVSDTAVGVTVHV